MASEPPKEIMPPSRSVKTKLVKRFRVTRKGAVVSIKEERVLFENRTVGVKEQVADAHFKTFKSGLKLGGVAKRSRLVWPDDRAASFPTKTVLPSQGTPTRFSVRVATQPVSPAAEAPSPAKIVLNMGTVIQVQSSEGALVNKTIRTVLEMEGGREQIKEILKQQSVIAGGPLRRAMRIRRA